MVAGPDGREEALIQHRLDRVAQDLDAPHPRVAGGRSRVLVHAPDGRAQQHDAVADQRGIEAAFEHVHERENREGPGASRLGRRAEKIDQHRVVLRDRNRPARRVDEAGLRVRVQDDRPAREARHDGEGQARQLLAAGAEEEGKAPDHAVPPGGDVGQPLVHRRAPHGGGRPDEGLELLGDARARIEGPRPLRHHRHDHVAGATHRLGERAVLGPLRVEEDREGYHARGGGPEGVEGVGVERAGPGRERAVAPEQRLVALLVDAHDHGGARGLGRARVEEQVADPRAGGGEETPERSGGEHERDAERGRRAREQTRALTPGGGLHRPTVSIETSGGTRKRTGTMLVPMPGETKRSRSSSWMWPIA